MPNIINNLKIMGEKEIIALYVQLIAQKHIQRVFFSFKYS